MNISEVFRGYVAPFDIKNPKIVGKIDHTYHVAETAKDIAVHVGADPELSWYVGFLHDIGRFAQLDKFDSYSDANIDHAEYGYDFLKNGGLRQFGVSPVYDDIILKAVRYHNKLLLPDGLSAEERLYCKLVRDADKIDIIRQSETLDFETYYMLTEEEVRNSTISDAVFSCFMEHRLIPFQYISTPADKFLLTRGMCFDINFGYSFKLLRKQGVFERSLYFYFRDEETRRRFRMIRDELLNYVYVIQGVLHE